MCDRCKRQEGNKMKLVTCKLTLLTIPNLGLLESKSMYL